MAPLVGLSGSGSARRWARSSLGVALSLAFLALALRGIEWGEVARSFAQANYLALLAALGLVLATIMMKALRWGVILSLAGKTPPTRRLFSTLLVGQMVNAVLPARLGELARAYLLAELEGIGKTLALLSILMEKALDSLMLIALLAGLSLAMPLPSWLRLSAAAFSLAALILVLLVALALWLRGLLPLSLKRMVSSSWLARYLRVPPTYLREWEGLFLPWRHPPEFLALLGFSGVIWLLGGLTNHIVAQALRVPLPLVGSFLLLAALHLGVILPSSPARIGVFHYICLLSLRAFSIDRSLALSYAFVLHIIVFLPIISLGAFYLWKENYTLARLSKAAAAKG